MGRLARYLPAVFFAAAVALFGFAAWAYFAESGATANSLEVDRSALDELAAMPLDPGEYPVKLRVRNTSDTPQRVVGFTPT